MMFCRLERWRTPFRIRMGDALTESGTAPDALCLIAQAGRSLMVSARHDWQNDAACLGAELNDFFDNYEDDPKARPQVDNLCMGCPVMQTCFAYGKFFASTGVWGGIYLDEGEMSQEYNDHKTPNDWAMVYAALTK